MRVKDYFIDKTFVGLNASQEFVSWVSGPDVPRSRDLGFWVPGPGPHFRLWRKLEIRGTDMSWRKSTAIDFEIVQSGTALLFLSTFEESF